MKKLLTILMLSLLVFSCTVKTNYTDTPTKFAVNEVEYHPIGGDNTLQTTPYWKLHLVNASDTITVTSLRSYEVGDSTEVIIRQFHRDGE
jgi:hypothetical protein